MFDIVTYCSTNYKKRFLQFLPSWLNSDVNKIHIYHEYHMNFNGYSDKIKSYESFGMCNDKSVHFSRKVESLFIHTKQFVRPIIFLDVDCIIKRDLSSIFEEKFDIGITVDSRKKFNKQINDVSSGVLFLHPTEKSKQFIEDWNNWQRLSTERSKDQIYLSKLIMSKQKNKDIIIKRFDENLYNYYPKTNSANDIKQWIRETNNNVYIKHYAHGIGIECLSLN